MTFAQVDELAAGGARWAKCSFPISAYCTSSEGEVHNTKGQTMKRTLWVATKHNQC